MKLSQVAAQLYTVRDFTKTPKDIAAALKRIRAIGYGAVQVSCIGPIADDELARILKGEGLVCCGTHEDGERLLADPQGFVEHLRKLDCRITTYPWPGERRFDSLEIVRSLKIPIREIRLTGGGAKSAVWRQIQADVFQDTVVTINAEEGPAFGAAIIAGVGTGVYRDFKDATGKLIRVTRRIEPNPQTAKVYDRQYALFQKLYAHLKEDFAALAASR